MLWHAPCRATHAAFDVYSGEFPCVVNALVSRSYDMHASTQAPLCWSQQCWHPLTPSRFSKQWRMGQVCGMADPVSSLGGNNPPALYYAWVHNPEDRVVRVQVQLGSSPLFTWDARHRLWDSQ